MRPTPRRAWGPVGGQGGGGQDHAAAGEAATELVPRPGQPAADRAGRASEPSCRLVEGEALDTSRLGFATNARTNIRNFTSDLASSATFNPTAYHQLEDHSWRAVRQLPARPEPRQRLDAAAGRLDGDGRRHAERERPRCDEDARRVRRGSASRSATGSSSRPRCARTRTARSARTSRAWCTRRSALSCVDLGRELLPEASVH